MPFANQTREHEARAYCAQIGADPDEIVGGYDHRNFRQGEYVRQARWLWYVGVSEARSRRPV